MKKSTKTITVFLAVLFLASSAVYSQVKPVTKVQAGPMVLPVDVAVEYINALNCMCEENLKRYVKTMAPKTVQVSLKNNSNARVTVKLEVSWISRYRNPGKTFSIDPRTITLEPKSSKLEIIFQNTYYDLMQTPDGITATISIIGKRFRDSNPRNNSKNIKECFYYMF